MTVGASDEVSCCRRKVEEGVSAVLRTTGRALHALATTCVDKIK